MILSKYIFFAWCSVMAAVSYLLMAEFNYFYNANQSLEKLKDEYALIISQAKRSTDLNDEEQSKQGGENKGEIKKTEFLVVNRKPAYLKKSAISFARRHKLEQDLKRMYLTDLRVAVKKDNSGNKGIKFYRKAQHDTNSLVKEAIFVWPLKRSNCYLSSRFGPRKKPNGSWEFHTGLDLAACRGEPIKASGSGRVIKAQFEPGYGNTVIIEHGSKFKTRYAHLDKILVKYGQDILQGEILGKVGSTGCVRASKRGGDPSHLHFEVYVNGKQVNPLYYLK